VTWTDAGLTHTLTKTVDMRDTTVSHDNTSQQTHGDRDDGVLGEHHYSALQGEHVDTALVQKGVSVQVAISYQGSVFLERTEIARNSSVWTRIPVETTMNSGVPTYTKKLTVIFHYSITQGASRVNLALSNVTPPVVTGIATQMS